MYKDKFTATSTLNSLSLTNFFILFNHHRNQWCRRRFVWWRGRGGFVCREQEGGDTKRGDNSTSQEREQEKGKICNNCEKLIVSHSFYFNITFYMSSYTCTCNFMHLSIFNEEKKKLNDKCGSPWICAHIPVHLENWKLWLIVHLCATEHVYFYLKLCVLSLASNRSSAHVWRWSKPSSSCNKEAKKARVRWGK